MNKPLIAAMLTGLLLSGCGFRQSSFNPFNWFGNSKPAAASQTATPAIKATGPVTELVQTVTALKVEKVPGGALIHVTGLPPSQGWWNAGLVAENGGQPVKGVLTYRFEITPPPGQTRTSTPQSREVTVAVYVSDAQLQGVRQITVTGSTNARSSRR